MFSKTLIAKTKKFLIDENTKSTRNVKIELYKLIFLSNFYRKQYMSPSSQTDPQTTSAKMK